MNCIRAQTVPKMPNILAAFGALPPMKSSTSFGRTGAINPSVSMSSVTVIRTKMTAALRGFMSFFEASHSQKTRAMATETNSRPVAQSESEIDEKMFAFDYEHSSNSR